MGIIPFSKPSLGQQEKDAVLRVIDSGWLASGKETAAFEKEFADYVGVRYAIFTNSGTSALKMAYKYFKEERNKKYYVTPKNTFCATYSSAEEMGLKPFPMKEHRESTVFVSVHYGGVKRLVPCDLEDSAHRIERNDPLIGKIRAYSFYATKNMTTGSGGMVVTDDKEIYEMLRLYWRDGLTSSTFDRLVGSVTGTGGLSTYDVVSMAGGYDGNDILASIGREQLKKLPQFTARRNGIVKKYNDGFDQLWKGNHLYPYMTNHIVEVNNLRQYLLDNEISSGYHYPGNTWKGVSLPLYPSLDNNDVDKIIKTVNKWRKNFGR